MPDKDKFIRIDEDLHFRVRVAASLQGMSIKAYSDRALRQALSSTSPGDGPGRIVAAYLAGHITAEEAMEAVAASPAVLGREGT